VDAFPQKIPDTNREAITDTNVIIPQKRDLKEFWREISPLEEADRATRIRQELAPYIGGVFLLRWQSDRGEDREYTYKLLGAKQAENNRWYFQLENTELTSSFNQDALERIQARDGVVYPRFPMDSTFNSAMGAPAGGAILLSDEMEISFH
jgi:hypothetical protein